MDNYAVHLDVREYAPKDKHPKIFQAFDGLKSGEIMELINDHDPLPLKYQFQEERLGLFEWEYFEEGPDIWRVGITRK